MKAFWNLALVLAPFWKENAFLNSVLMENVIKKRISFGFMCDIILLKNVVEVMPKHCLTKYFFQRIRLKQGLKHRFPQHLF